MEDPARRAGLAAPRLVVLPSPYRFVLSPILNYILELERDNPDRQIAVLIPELVERRWYHYFLHNQRAEWLRALLLAKGNQRIILVNVPWHIRARTEPPSLPSSSVAVATEGRVDSISTAHSPQG